MKNQLILTVIACGTELGPSEIHKCSKYFYLDWQCQIHDSLVSSFSPFPRYVRGLTEVPDNLLVSYLHEYCFQQLWQYHVLQYLYSHKCMNRVDFELDIIRKHPFYGLYADMLSSVFHCLKPRWHTMLRYIYSNFLRHSILEYTITFTIQKKSFKRHYLAPSRKTLDYIGLFQI